MPRVASVLYDAACARKPGSSMPPLIGLRRGNSDLSMQQVNRGVINALQISGTSSNSMPFLMQASSMTSSLLRV